MFIGSQPGNPQLPMKRPLILSPNRLSPIPAGGELQVTLSSKDPCYTVFTLISILRAPIMLRWFMDAPDPEVWTSESPFAGIAIPAILVSIRLYGFAGIAIPAILVSTDLMDSEVPICWYRDTSDTGIDASLHSRCAPVNSVTHTHSPTLTYIPYLLYAYLLLTSHTTVTTCKDIRFHCSPHTAYVWSHAYGLIVNPVTM
jgi:hypothetical protein